MTIPAFLLPLERTTAAAVAAAGGAAGSQQSLNGFAVQQQEQTEWCWAAVSASVAVYFGPTLWTQCRVATAELSPLNCCGGDAGNGCNQPWYLDAALSRVGHFSRIDAASLPFSGVQTEISGGRPLGCRIAWSGGGAHFIALGGWLIGADGTQYVRVHDPFYGVKQTSYPNLVSAYQTAGDSWTHTYFTLSTPPAGAAGGGVPADSPKNA
jgi:hypothetical protein